MLRDHIERHEVHADETALMPRAVPFKRDAIFEQYLNRLPMGLAFAAANGALLFETPEGRRQLARWNRGLTLTAGEKRGALPTRLDQWLEGAQPCGAGSWSVRHPRHMDLHIRIDESRAERGGALMGYWITFLQRPEPEQADRDFSGSAIDALQALSPSERKVATLVARGLTNEQVAEAIARSVRTVEYQLNSVYRKLRIRGRTRLALALA